MLPLSLNWASSCLFLFIHFQTYSWRRKVLLCTMRAGAVSQDTRATRAPSQQVWLYFKSSKALCGQGRCAGNRMDKNTTFTSQKDRSRDRSSSVVMVLAGGQMWYQLCGCLFTWIKAQKRSWILISESESSVLQLSALTTTLSKMHMLSDFARSEELCYVASPSQERHGHWPHPD